MCATLLKSIDWRDLAQQVDAKRPKSLPAPVDLYAELDILGMDKVRAAAASANRALYDIELWTQTRSEFDSDKYSELQGIFDQRRLSYVKAVRQALDIKAL